MCVSVCSHICGYLQRPEEGFRFSRAGVVCGCEPADVGADMVSLE